MNRTQPNHVAIIMDGNRRWAKTRGLAIQKGHEAGADALEQTVRSAIKFGIRYLTVFTLSTENLRERSNFEISFLFSLLEKVVQKKLSILEENGVHLKCIGDLTGLPDKLQKILASAEERLSRNNRLFLNVAINYGSRDEIVQAVRKINKSPDEINEEDIEAHLYTAGIPDPDLIIRTGGQKRQSNFLLWQGSYAELYFTDTLWPGFTEKEFKKALKDYSQRKRNFGR